MLVAEFLASDEAEDLSDRSAASRCADHIVDYGCDRDFGRPLRVSPAKAETFLLDWLPRRVVLSPAEQHAMPHVLAAWVRWAGSRTGLGNTAIGTALDAVFDSMGTFTRVYHDPAAFGLEASLVARLLPDSDLEALPRRAFAFPVLMGHYRGTDLGALDPARPAPGLPTAGRCWPPTMMTRRLGAAMTRISTGTSPSPTGSGAATRPSCGKPRSGCWTWARTGTPCCTR